MYKDAKEELKRLEEQLLAEEDEKTEEPAAIGSDFTDEELAQIKELLKEPAVPVRNFANNYTAYTAGKTDLKAEDLSRALLEEEEADRKAANRLVVVAMCLLAGILGVLVWWLIRFRGLL